MKKAGHLIFFAKYLQKLFFEDTKEKSENLTIITKSFLDLPCINTTAILEEILKILNSSFNKYYLKYDREKNKIKSYARDLNKLVDKYCPICNEYFGDNLNEHILTIHAQNKYSIIVSNGDDSFCCKNCKHNNLHFWEVPEYNIFNHVKGSCKNAEFWYTTPSQLVYQYQNMLNSDSQPLEDNYD